jgi:hypothetical protein
MATSASAALVDLGGGSETTLPAGTGTGAGVYDLMDNADPWGPETEVFTGNTSFLGASATHVTLTFRGNESGFNNTLATADGTTLFTANTTDEAGTSVELTADEFLGLQFFSKGTGDGVGLDSDQVAVTAMANVLEIGFNDSYSGDADFDDLRVEAIVTPVPAALPLMATGLAGMAWWGRRQRRAAS